MIKTGQSSQRLMSVRSITLARSTAPITRKHKAKTSAGPWSEDPVGTVGNEKDRPVAKEVPGFDHPQIIQEDETPTRMIPRPMIRRPSDCVCVGCIGSLRSACALDTI